MIPIVRIIVKIILKWLRQHHILVGQIYDIAHKGILVTKKHGMSKLNNRLASVNINDNKSVIDLIQSLDEDRLNCQLLLTELKPDILNIIKLAFDMWLQDITRSGGDKL